METSLATGRDNVRLQVEFIISVASTMAYQNIGVIAYSTDAHFVIRPGHSANMTQFAHTLRTFNYVMGCRSNLKKAFTKANEESQLFSASKSAVIGVLSPPWGSSEDPMTIASELKSRNVTIIGFALDTTSTGYIADLVTSLSADHLLISSSTTYLDLQNMVESARDLICRGLQS